MKKLLLGTALTLSLVGSANAGIVTATLTTGVYTPFDEYAVGTKSGTTLTENGATTFSTTGNSFVTNTSLHFQYSKPLMDGPDGSLSNYIFATPGSACCAGASNVDIGYDHDVYSFKILWGSPDKSTPDTYNLITLSNGDTISGSTILGMTGTASGDNAGTRWWLIQDTTPFDGWTASASGIAFEFDLNGVPEPSTWAMMGLGFAALAYAGFRRSTKTSAAIA